MRGRILRYNRTRLGQPGPSVEADVRRLTSVLDGPRELSEGEEADQKDAINRSEAVEGRKRNWDEDDRINDSLGGAYGLL